jgi:hypothetical protein
LLNVKRSVPASWFGTIFSASRTSGTKTRSASRRGARSRDCAPSRSRSGRRSARGALEALAVRHEILAHGHGGLAADHAAEADVIDQLLLAQALAPRIEAEVDHRKPSSRVFLSKL